MALLELADVRAGYDGIEVLRGIDLAVESDEIVALVGSNGAGKTTTVLTICGRLDPTGGSIRYDGTEIGGLSPHRVVDRGIVLVPENRDLFTGLSVLDNLRLGARRPVAREHREANIERAFDLFPRLEERTDQTAGTLSGGEQQMLTIARALVGEPDMLILDEPSIGLAPNLVDEVFDVLREIHASGLPVLIIEQNVKQTLELADRGYVMENGRITLQGAGDDLLEDGSVVEAYLGV
jgi:branched-chain amino acid transport system ATP-binding protein